MVLNAGTDPKGYAACVLKTAAEFQSTPAFGPSMARQSDLESRLLAVLDGTRSRGRATPLIQMAMVATVIGFLVPISTLALQENTPGDNSNSVTRAATSGDQDFIRLRDAVRSDDNQHRQQAQEELEALGKNHPTVEELSDSLFDEYESDSRLFRDVGTHDNDMTVLLVSLQSAFAVKRAGAAQGLGQYKNPDVVVALIESLQDPNWHVREWSARSLGDIGIRPRFRTA